MKEDARDIKILKNIYRYSVKTSLISPAIISILEVFMFAYTYLNPDLYGPFILRYRLFYTSLLLGTLIYITLTFFAVQDIDKRYKVLNIANPIFSAFAAGWSLAVTYSDASVTGVVDATVFMTFSVAIPLSFYVSPAFFAFTTLVSDLVLLCIYFKVSGGVGGAINYSVFFVFQYVLGINFLNLKRMLTERYLIEHENAGIDVMTGLLNRRIYEEDIKKYSEEAKQKDLTYFSIDLNSLKEVNDTNGHDAGDRQIINAAKCISTHIGKRGRTYRVGGDEFVAIIFANEEETKALLADYNKAVSECPKQGEFELSTAVGYVRQEEFMDKDVIELAKIADERMYAAKAEYYLTTGKDRRK